jgi:hypothetical protein
LNPAAPLPTIVSPSAIMAAYPGVSEARAKELANGPLNGAHAWPPAISPDAAALCQMPNGVLTRRGVDGQVWIYTPSNPPRWFAAPPAYTSAMPENEGKTVRFLLPNGMAVLVQGTALDAPKTPAGRPSLTAVAAQRPVSPGKLGPGARIEDGGRVRMSIDGRPFAFTVAQPGVPSTASATIGNVRMSDGRLHGFSVTYKIPGDAAPFKASYVYDGHGLAKAAAPSAPAPEPGYTYEGSRIVERAGMKLPFLITTPAFQFVRDGKIVMQPAMSVELSTKEEAERFARVHAQVRKEDAELVDALFDGPAIGPGR